MKKQLVLFVLLAGLFAEAAPKNIILFIGDGMGPAQVTAGKVAKGTLEMERCPVTALVTTWSASSLVTDSAASGTAMATGIKTKNGMISQSPDGSRLQTVLEVAEKQDKSTGLVANCAVTHATPASFAAHVPSRNQYQEIARQLAASDVDVLFGGGLDHFSPTNAPSCLPELEAKMTVVKTAEEFRVLDTPERAAALLYPVHPPIAAQRSVPLAELTAKAIEILSQDDDGFFLMVEGSQIDWMGHQNNGTNLVAEVVDFDDAVGVGLDFAENNGETLVIITADHETGGFALLGGSLAEKTVSKTGFSSDYHSAVMVPLFAFGPGREAFGGMMDNTDIGKTMIGFFQAAE
jgi:alkaline phosphatase